MPGLSSSLRQAASLRSSGADYHLEQRESHIINEDSMYEESLANSTPTTASSTGGFLASPVGAAEPSFVSASTTIPTSSNTTAGQARRDWQTHGMGLSTALEDKRLRGPCIVRLVGAVDRFDASQARFTAYSIQVSNSSFQQASGMSVLSSCTTPTMTNQASPTNWTVERRYSDFCKLQEIVQQHNVQFYQDDSQRSPVVFPGKHWAGRVGNWTPSLLWAPEKHDALVQYRSVQLDIWLVHVVEWYNQQQHAPSDYNYKTKATLVTAIWQFLTEPFRPPCQQDGAVTSPAKAFDWKWHNPFSFSLTSSVRQATHTISDMVIGRVPVQQESPTIYVSRHQQQQHHHHGTVLEADRTIPLDLLQAARGLVFMTVLKAGLVVSGRVGTGLVIARLDKNTDTSQPAIWSAPCAMGTVGMGWGALIGGDVTHYLVVLTTEKAVQDLVSSSSIQLGAELGVAVGPVGRGATGQVAVSVCRCGDSVWS